MAARYLLPALAIAGRAAAAQCSGTTTISTQAQATQLATCEQYTGTIWIGKSTQGDIDLSGIQRIQGSLLARDVMQMTSLTADTLSTISQTFGLDTISGLTTLNFPSLVGVDSIIWSGLPVLQQLSFTQQVQKANVVSIVNTNLYSLEGIDLQEIGTLYISNNNYLTEVNMQLTNVTQGLVIASNNAHTQVSLPNLEWAANLTIQNVQSIDIGSLSFVDGSAGFKENYFSQFQAANLTAVKDTLSFVGNDQLTTLSLPQITEIGGGLVVANNTKINSINGFPKLGRIFGNIDFTGAFKSATLPKLRYVQGAFYMASSEDISSDCSHFKSLSSNGGNGDIRGSFSCIPNQGSAATKGAPGSGSGGSGSGSGSSSGSDSGSSGKSGAASLLIPYTTGFIGVVAAVFGML